MTTDYNDWDEVPEVPAEVIEEREAEESYSLYGFNYILTHDRIEGFAKWWQGRGRHMTRPLDLKITY